MRPRHFALAASALAVALAFAPAPAHAALYYYSAILNPRQEVPLVASSAMGGGWFFIDTQANTVNYWISWANLSSPELFAHIHLGAAGVNGGVKHTLPNGNPKVGTWNYAEADEPAILAGQMYANIHSNNFGNGEVRGQIVPFNALLGANQESPTNASLGSGWAIAVADTALNTLTYRVFYENLTGAPNLAHFHGNALHGTSASPKVNLTVTASPMTGTVAYNPADEGALLAGRWYVNLHTAANPGGEIRGQLVPRVVPMDAFQETPVNFSLGSAGFAQVAIDTALNTLSYDVRTLALSSAETAAHIHGFAGLGSSAPPLATLAAGSPKIGTWNYGAPNEAQVLLGQAYFNVHTTTNPNGEIRGQIFSLPGSEAVTGVEDGPPHRIPRPAARDSHSNSHAADQRRSRSSAWTAARFARSWPEGSRRGRTRSIGTAATRRAARWRRGCISRSRARPPACTSRGSRDSSSASALTLPADANRPAPLGTGRCRVPRAGRP
jgi:hypothetical protein